jgi:hypothetical protein
LDDTRLYELLLKIDEDLCEAVRLEGCLYCGGELHRADYPRKPRGVREEVLPEGYDRRLSLCCDRDGCRKRATPPSVRYLGRKVYLGAVVALATAMQQGPAAWVLTKLEKLLGVGRRTVNRWRRWWQEAFVATPLWKVTRGQLMPVVDEEELPRSLLERFTGDARCRLVALLRLLEPLTTTSCGQGFHGMSSARRRCSSPASEEDV